MTALPAMVLENVPRTKSKVIGLVALTVTDEPAAEQDPFTETSPDVSPIEEAATATSPTWDALGGDGSVGAKTANLAAS